MAPLMYGYFLQFASLVAQLRAAAAEPHLFAPEMTSLVQQLRVFLGVGLGVGVILLPSVPYVNSSHVLVFAVNLYRLHGFRQSFTPFLQPPADIGPMLDLHHFGPPLFGGLQVHCALQAASVFVPHVILKVLYAFAFPSF